MVVISDQVDPNAEIVKNYVQVFILNSSNYFVFIKFLLKVHSFEVNRKRSRNSRCRVVLTPF